MFKLEKKSFLVVLLATLMILVLTPLLSNKTRENNLDEVKDWSGKIDPLKKVAYFEGQEVKVPENILKDFPTTVLGVSDEERYIEVDLSEQKLRAWEGDQLFLETLVSTGLPYFPTPTGEFRIWAKARATRMEGGEGRYYYNLPNVPYVMFFENDKVPGWRGYGLHGTYWHNDFGTVHSHGCVNLPTVVAQRLYSWTGPVMPEGKSFIRSSEENPGTKVIIHE